MLFKTNTNGHKHPNSSLSIIEQDTIGETNENNKWHSTQEPRTPKNSPIDNGVHRCQWSKAAMRPVADYCRQPLMTLCFGISNSLLAVVRQKCVRCLSRRIIQASHWVKADRGSVLNDDDDDVDDDGNDDDADGYDDDDGVLEWIMISSHILWWV